MLHFFLDRLRALIAFELRFTADFVLFLPMGLRPSGQEWRVPWSAAHTRGRCLL